MLSDGPLLLPAPGDIFPGLAPADRRAVLAAAGKPDDRTAVAQNCLLLEAGGERLLFDCGLGSTKLYGDESGRLLDAFAAAGQDPAQVDAVVLTHAHTDHCWGVMGDDGRAAFPNARIVMSRKELAFWEADATSFPRSREGIRTHLLPLRDRIVFVEDGEAVAPGVTAEATPGHTPGHLSFWIRSGDAAVCVAGDAVFHDPLSYRFPGAATSYDGDPPTAQATRQRLLARLARGGEGLASYHADWPGLGRVAAEGGSFRFVPCAGFP